MSDKKKDPKPIGKPGNAESGGGSTGKSRSRAEDKFRKAYDKRQANKITPEADDDGG